MKHGLFDSAVTKLTLVYTLILAIICIGFSTAFFLATDRELNRPVDFRADSAPTILFDNNNDDFRVIIEQRDNAMRANLIVTLIIINSCVLLLGACASYFLARWTLAPIHQMTEQQAHFVSDASHELRTPLTAIAMENEVALRDPNLTKSELIDIVKSNLEETHKLQTLTDRLLKLSQQEHLTLSPIDLALPVTTAIDNLSTIAKHKNIRLASHVKTFPTTSDADALTNVLTILIENAIKYSPKDSTVTVSFKDHKLSVTDQGPGIAEEDLPHIFDRFYRAEKSRTSHGYGLGLALAKQLATELHLKLTATNNPDHGATFSLEPFS